MTFRHKLFCLRPRDEHAGCHMEHMVAEDALVKRILHRHALHQLVGYVIETLPVGH